MHSFIAALSLLFAATSARAQEFGSPELIEKAKAEGHVFLYSVNFTETEQAFDRRVQQAVSRPSKVEFDPRARWAIDHAHPDGIRGRQTRGGRHRLFRIAGICGRCLICIRTIARRTPMLINRRRLPIQRNSRPRTTTGWCIAHNSELVSDPPKSWMDLTDLKWKGGKIAQVIAGGGGPTWNRVLLLKAQVLGVEYWSKLAVNQTLLFPSGAPATDATHPR